MLFAMWLTCWRDKRKKTILRDYLRRLRDAASSKAIIIIGERPKSRAHGGLAFFARGVATFLFRKERCERTCKTGFSDKRQHPPAAVMLVLFKEWSYQLSFFFLRCHESCIGFRHDWNNKRVTSKSKSHPPWEGWCVYGSCCRVSRGDRSRPRGIDCLGKPTSYVCIYMYFVWLLCHLLTRGGSGLPGVDESFLTYIQNIYIYIYIAVSYYTISYTAVQVHRKHTLACILFSSTFFTTTPTNKNKYCPIRWSPTR